MITLSYKKPGNRVSLHVENQCLYYLKLFTKIQCTLNKISNWLSLLFFLNYSTINLNNFENNTSISSIVNELSGSLNNI